MHPRFGLEVFTKSLNASSSDLIHLSSSVRGIWVTAFFYRMEGFQPSGNYVRLMGITTGKRKLDYFCVQRKRWAFKDMSLAWKWKKKKNVRVQTVSRSDRVRWFITCLCGGLYSPLNLGNIIFIYYSYVVKISQEGNFAVLICWARF